VPVIVTAAIRIAMPVPIVPAIPVVVSVIRSIPIIPIRIGVRVAIIIGNTWVFAVNRSTIPAITVTGFPCASGCQQQQREPANSNC
jgi:hypothetical protein